MWRCMHWTTAMMWPNAIVSVNERMAKLSIYLVERLVYTILVYPVSYCVSCELLCINWNEP